MAGSLKHKDRTAPLTLAQYEGDEHEVTGGWSGALMTWDAAASPLNWSFQSGVRVFTAGEAQPKAQLSETLLQFGPGGATVPDTIVTRIGVATLKLSSSGTNPFTLQFVRPSDQTTIAGQLYIEPSGNALHVKANNSPLYLDSRDGVFITPPSTGGGGVNPGLTHQGGSVTGSNTVGAFVQTFTLNTTGIVHVNDYSYIVTAAAAASTAFRIRAGAAGTTDRFAVRLSDGAISKTGAFQFPGITMGNAEYVGVAGGGATSHRSDYTAAWISLETNGNLTGTSGAYAHVRTLGTFAPAAGSAIVAGLHLNPIFNASGAQSGAAYGMLVAPRFTAWTGAQRIASFGTTTQDGFTGYTDVCSITSAGLFLKTSTVMPPLVTGTVAQFAATDGFVTGLQLDSAAVHGQVLFRRSEGTYASPSATGANVIMGHLAARGHDGSNYTAAVASFRIVSGAAFTASSMETHFQFLTTAAGSTGAAQVAFLDQGLTLGGNRCATLASGSLSMTRLGAPTNTAPGTLNAKFEVVPGTTAGTAKLIMYAGTSTTPTTIIDNVGAGLT